MSACPCMGWCFRIVKRVQWLQLASFSFDYRRESYSQNYDCQKACVFCPFKDSLFRLCNLWNRHIIFFFFSCYDWCQLVFAFPRSTLRSPWTNAFIWGLVSTVGGVAGIFFFWPMASVIAFFATTSWLI